MDTIVYAARLKNNIDLEKSSSGGVYTALSNVFLKNGGAVACSLYDYKEKKTIFKIITSIDERNRSRGSKYMQSYPQNIFRQIKEWLEINEGKKLLFVGTGCQADGFRKYAENIGIKDRVYIVDLICHGVRSPMLWKEYASMLEKKSGKIEDLSFKDKRNGWLTPTFVCKIKKKEYFIDDYVNIYFNECALRPSCYVCNYSRVKRSVDITIGDYWGIDNKLPEFYSEMGNSLVLLHTEKGVKLFEACKEDLLYKESNVNDCMQPNLYKPTSKCPERKIFWKRYKKYGIKYILKKYGRYTVRWKIKRKIWKIFLKNV